MNLISINERLLTFQDKVSISYEMKQELVCISLHPHEVKNKKIQQNTNEKLSHNAM